MPIVVFNKVDTNVYIPLIIGAPLVGEDLATGHVLIAVDENSKNLYNRSLDNPNFIPGEIERKYITTTAQQRVHQPIFRTQVLYPTTQNVQFVL